MLGTKRPGSETFITDSAQLKVILTVFIALASRFAFFHSALLEPVRMPERDTQSPVIDADVILRQVSALLGHDFITATRLLAALEAFSHRLPPLERRNSRASCTARRTRLAERVGSQDE
jgi:hypothetical protein